jgi:tetratricopeptide (TPR) repeat protein
MMSAHVSKKLLASWLTVPLTGVLVLVLPLGAQPATHDLELEQLRTELAMRWLEPEPHMALAKYVHDRGDRLLAFYILENIRRTRFPQEVFDQAFSDVFLERKDFDNSPEAEAAARTAVEAAPVDPEALTHLADIYISREEYAAAAPLLERAIESQPDDSAAWFALVETYRRQGRAEDATRTMERFVETNPGSPEVVLQQTAALMESDPAEARGILQQAVETHPGSGALLFNLATVTQQEGDLDEAERLVREAARLSPDNAHIQGWTGRFLLKVADDPEGALKHYLNAYFLDPHFYDTEYAESRIRSLAWEMAEKEMEHLSQQGTSIEALLRNSNPVIASEALERAKGDWKSAYIEPVVELMTHDDPGLRWGATAALMENADDSFDERLEQLLEDADLRRRGLAAYIAIHRWGQEAFPFLRNLLHSEAQMVRYDAISALLLEGGEPGKTLLRKYREQETNGMLAEILDAYAVAEQ